MSFGTLRKRCLCLWLVSVVLTVTGCTSSTSPQVVECPRIPKPPPALMQPPPTLKPLHPSQTITPSVTTPEQP